MNTELLLLLCLGVIAFLYSSVGHGGASGYLAIMAIFSIQPELMRSSALLLNLFVAGISFLAFQREGYFKWNLLWPFLLTSMPAAFFGARFHLDPFIYKSLLGTFLLFAALRLVINPGKDTMEKRSLPVGLAITTGFVIGLLSGMIGIGGGVLLTPFLLIGRFAKAKEASAVSALFIFLNSLTGLAGVASKGFHLTPELSGWIAVAVSGAFLGSFAGSQRFSELHLRRVLSLVLLFATIKLFLI